jgi:hypothetical protein
MSDDTMNQIFPTNDEPNTFTPQPWQQVIINSVDAHGALVDREEFQAMSDFEINQQTKISVSMPTKSGHTALAAYLSSAFPTAMLSFGIEHWADICKEMSKFNLFPNVDTVALSIYQIFYAITQSPNDVQASLMLESLKNKIASKRVIVIDDSIKVPPVVLDFVYNVVDGSKTVIVLLK